MGIHQLVSNLINRIKGIPKWLPVLFAVVAFIGFLDASYLTIQHYKGIPPPCSLVEGCEKVTTSEYSTVIGMPVALPGAIYYLVILILTVLYLDSKNKKHMVLAAMLTPLGLIASLWFLFLQFFVINAICLYCLASAATSTTLFVLGTIVLRRTKPIIS